MNPNSLQVITAYVEPSLGTAKVGDLQFQRLGYFAVDKDSTTSKLVFNKTVGLKDAWEEKVKDTNSINNALKILINFFKVSTDDERTTIVK
jgi:glutaminyl-tRNA synthetase